jgi:hypothetical protein
MPWNRRGSINPVVIIMFSFAGMEAAIAGMLLLAQAPNGVFDTGPTAAYCIAGSVLGAFVSLTFLPEAGKAEARHVVRNLSVKFCAAAAVGLIWAPPIVRYYGIVDRDYIIGLSGILSLTGISILHVVLPEIPKVSKAFFRKKVKDYTGVEIQTERFDEPLPPKKPKPLPPPSDDFTPEL